MYRIRFIPVFVFIVSSLLAQEKELSPWENGYLDIHFISTGRGNSTFILMPDGTSLLVDAGDLNRDSERMAPPVPDQSKTPGQWIADYIHQFHPKGKRAELDYVLITHYHGDHIGSFTLQSETHVRGDYKLAGITEVGSLIPVKKLIDSGDDFRRPEKNSGTGRLNQLKEYRKFIGYQHKANGLQYEKFRVGSCSQIKMKENSEKYPDYVVKNLFSNGAIAAVSDSTIAIRKFKEGDFPPENDLSSGIRISYGLFDFYTGGDIPGIGHTGTPDTESMESLAAPVIGNVDVATLNHHGNRNSQNEFYVRTLQARVWIMQSWTIRHPGEEVLRRIMSPYVYPGERDLFTNFLHPVNKAYLGSRAEDFKSTAGHIVVRVYPDGKNYDVFVLDDQKNERQVVARNSYESKY
jgi:beta-lactamase superfamily II metal-dependent hydrolase